MVLKATQSCLDLGASNRLSTRGQAALRRRPGVFAPLGQTSSSSASSASELDEDVLHISNGADSPAAEVQPSTTNGEHIDAYQVFGDPFRFELYPAVSQLATHYDPNAEKRHWVLTVKLWYRVSLFPQKFCLNSNLVQYRIIRRRARRSSR